ncbi:MAG TPA: ABC transporter permease [Actinomycetota bacterium]|jgi:ABC-2 type transport system permease protein|nr:ABC transporter permease [Actinomycetota bacterium]
MRKLFGASAKMIYRDKQALFWALAFPVIFAVVFGLFDFEQTPEVKIDLVGETASPVFGAMEQGLGSIETFVVTERADLDASAARLDDGDTDVVIAVQGTGVDVLYDETNFQTNQFAITAIERIVDRVNLEAAGVSEPMVSMDARGVASSDVSYYDFLLPGLVAMGVMNASIIGMAVAISRFREQRILRRILATPLAPIRFLSSQVGARLVLSIIQSALILAVGIFLFGAELHGQLIWLFVLVTFANLIFLNLGFAAAGRAKNPDAAQGIANAIALPMMFLSGTFFPTDTLPVVVQWIVKFLPLTPLLEAIRAVSVEGDPITSVGPQILALTIWVAVSFVLANRLFRFEEV